MKHLIVVLFIVCVTSCNKQSPIENSESYTEYSDLAMDEEISVVKKGSEVASGQSNSTQKVDKKKIIKDGRLGLKVKDLRKSKAAVDELVKANAAYYGNENLNNSTHQSVYTLSIRIPAENFEKFVAALEEEGHEILHKNIVSRDVTDQFIDIETRLQNKRSYLNRYKDILKKANTIKEILEVEEIIRRLEEEIESSEGRLRYLADQVGYSTLDLRLTKEFEYNAPRRDSFFEKAKQSISSGWYGLVSFVVFLLRIWPLWILLGVALFFFKGYLGRKKRKK